MAHVKLLRVPTRFIRVAYFVDAMVGRGGANRRDDVLLVQFFLNTLWGKKPDNQEVIGDSGPAPRIDGDCGSETINAIAVFQRFYWETTKTARGFSDGRVEPLPPGKTFTPLRDVPYTMIGLNVNYGVLLGSDRHALLWKEPNFPSELTLKLFA